LIHIGLAHPPGRFLSVPPHLWSAPLLLSLPVHIQAVKPDNDQDSFPGFVP
jgi:hypothetical protein